MRLRVIVLCATMTMMALWVPPGALAAGEKATVTGEVIDSACYIKSGMKGHNNKKKRPVNDGHCRSPTSALQTLADGAPTRKIQSHRICLPALCPNFTRK